MITNKERLEALFEQIKRLELLSEEIREQDIYPVSFFSQAFDIVSKLQEDLQQIEVFQIELIEKQKKEHQAQLFTQEEMIAQKKMTPFGNSIQEPVVIKKTDPPQVNHQVDNEDYQPVIPPKVDSPQVHPDRPVQEEKKVIQSYLFEQKSLIDLKKMITLNDRFLFCRELFANNEQLMYQVLNELNMEESYNASVEYLQKRFEWDFEAYPVADFLAVLKKRFT